MLRTIALLTVTTLLAGAAIPDWKFEPTAEPDRNLYHCVTHYVEHMDDPVTSIDVMANLIFGVCRQEIRDHLDGSYPLDRAERAVRIELVQEALMRSRAEKRATVD